MPHPYYLDGGLMNDQTITTPAELDVAADVIEQAARVMYEHVMSRGTCCPRPWDAVDERSRDLWRAEARALAAAGLLAAPRTITPEQREEAARAAVESLLTTATESTGWLSDFDNVEVTDWHEQVEVASGGVIDVGQAVRVVLAAALGLAVSR